MASTLTIRQLFEILPIHLLHPVLFEHALLLRRKCEGVRNHVTPTTRNSHDSGPELSLPDDEREVQADDWRDSNSDSDSCCSADDDDDSD